MKTANIIVTEPGLGRKVNPYIGGEPENGFDTPAYIDFEATVKTITALTKDGKPLPKGWTGECELCYYYISDTYTIWCDLDVYNKLNSIKNGSAIACYIEHISPIKQQSAKDAHCNETVEQAAKRIRRERDKNEESYKFWAQEGMSFVKNGDTNVAFKDGFIQGAQWQAQQSKDMVSHIDTLIVEISSMKETLVWDRDEVLKILNKIKSLTNK